MGEPFLKNVANAYVTLIMNNRLEYLYITKKLYKKIYDYLNNKFENRFKNSFLQNSHEAKNDSEENSNNKSEIIDKNDNCEENKEF